jgi:hypothetical protein
MQPEVWTSDQAIFHGVVVDVIEVSVQVLLVTNRMFPETALPNPAFTMTQPRRRRVDPRSTLRRLNRWVVGRTRPTAQEV